MDYLIGWFGGNIGLLVFFFLLVVGKSALDRLGARHFVKCFNSGYSDALSRKPQRRWSRGYGSGFRAGVEVLTAFHNPKFETANLGGDDGFDEEL